MTCQLLFDHLVGDGEEGRRHVESESNLLRPFQTKIPFFAEFGIAFGYMFRCVSGPEVPEYFRAFRLLLASDAEASKG